nr:reverse transcriptase domain-containing protein [Tanacetum cinerariifolium]
MLRTCYGHGLTKGIIIQIFYRGLDGPTQEILDAGGIFLHNTPKEAFKILEDKVLLKLDFSDESQNSPNPKTIVSTGESNLNFDHALLMGKFKALTQKINYDFSKIRNELKEMRDGPRDNHASQLYMSDDMPMCDPMEANYIQGYYEGYHDQNSKNIPTKTTFVDDVLLNTIGKKEFKSIDGVRNERKTKKEINKDDVGLPKEHNKEWKLNEKVQVMEEDAWSRNRVISYAYASFCISFYHME